MIDYRSFTSKTLAVTLDIPLTSVTIKFSMNFDFCSCSCHFVIVFVRTSEYLTNRFVRHNVSKKAKNWIYPNESVPSHSPETLSDHNKKELHKVPLSVKNRKVQCFQLTQRLNFQLIIQDE